MKLQIGMRVKIKNKPEDFKLDSGMIKTITSYLPDYDTNRAFGLDGDLGIWLIEDFEELVDYPDQPME